jgi:hypothetical protein
MKSEHYGIGVERHAMWIIPLEVAGPQVVPVI